MTKSLFAAAALAACLGVSGTAALAQAESPCAAAAENAADDVMLRIQQAGLGAEDRESAKIHLVMAMTAAAAGNEDKCWRELQISSLFGAEPVFPGQNPTDVAAGSVPSGSSSGH
jgi:hypothetical protein